MLLRVKQEHFWDRIKKTLETLIDKTIHPGQPYTSQHIDAVLLKAKEKYVFRTPDENNTALQSPGSCGMVSFT